MATVKVQIKLSLSDGAELPIYASDGASGADVAALLEAPLSLCPLARAKIPTGLHLEIPLGFEAQLRSRSGLAIDHGIVVLNSPGTIDSDFRGEVFVLLANLGNRKFEVTSGMRIAQLVFTPVTRAYFELVDRIQESRRDRGGAGSTGGY